MTNWEKQNMGPGTNICVHCKGTKESSRFKSKWCRQCDSESRAIKSKVVARNMETDYRLSLIETEMVHISQHMRGTASRVTCDICLARNMVDKDFPEVMGL